MFRKAQQSVAHQSTLPSGFALGNRDLRSLQEVINSEKDFIKSNARSSHDYHKTAEALKAWSSAEGEDLHDVLGKLSLLFESYTTAQGRYNAHLSTIRQHFKSVRTREEALADMRARKRSLGSKIEGVEKKLAKMGPENKELMKTTGLLKELRGEMETLRVDVQVEEAAIGDFKRRTTREAMGIKCGGMLELAEKMTIIAEVGKLMIEEIPLEPTHPGMPRTDYLGGMRTDQLLQEATQGIADVGFSPAGPSNGMQRDYSHQHMRPSEIDDSTHEYYNTTADETNDRNGPAGWEQEHIDDGNMTGSRYEEDPTYEQQVPRQHSYDEENRSTPIYAQHSSNGTHASAAPIVTQDTATDEWRKSRIQQSTPTREAYPKAQSGTPIADHFASRSPDDVQVGGTGLHIVGKNTSNESFERANAANAMEEAPPMSPLPSAAAAAASSSTPAGSMLGTVEPARSTYGTPLPSQGEGTLAASGDDSYFQSVGSTRAAQQSVRRPMSPGVSAGNGGSAANSVQGHMSSPYEPPAEGRKMTAAAFRKGFGRAPSAQHMQHPAMGASTSSLGMTGQENDTAPLAIRKRISVVPGQTAGGDGAIDDHPAPPYQANNHQSIYGGLEDNELYAPPPPIVGQQGWGSRPNSRPTSAAGWRG